MRSRYQVCWGCHKKLCCPGHDILQRMIFQILLKTRNPHYRTEREIMSLNTHITETYHTGCTILLKSRPDATKSELETEVKTFVSRSGLSFSWSSSTSKVSWAFFAKSLAPLVLPGARICGRKANHSAQPQTGTPPPLSPAQVSIQPRQSRCTINVKWINERMKCMKLNHINMIPLNQSYFSLGWMGKGKGGWVGVRELGEGPSLMLGIGVVQLTSSLARLEPAWGHVSRTPLPSAGVEQPTRRVPFLLLFCFHSTLGFTLCNH